LSHTHLAATPCTPHIHQQASLHSASTFSSCLSKFNNFIFCLALSFAIVSQCHSLNSNTSFCVRVPLTCKHLAFIFSLYYSKIQTSLHILPRSTQSPRSVQGAIYINDDNMMLGTRHTMIK